MSIVPGSVPSLWILRDPSLGIPRDKEGTCALPSSFLVVSTRRFFTAEEFGSPPVFPGGLLLTAPLCCRPRLCSAQELCLSLIHI
eukprot:7411616-Pyramimonas_sp.AAC.1